MKSWPVGYEVPDATSSAESLDWAKAKLIECLTTHPACASNSTTLLPDRILDVGASPDDGIRLRVTNDTPGRYLCLSHCWGTQAFLCTLTSNIALHRDNIPLQSFPRTFKDAVSLTHLLGLRYLWIDSLCIVQDDEDDWRTQAGKMSDIYAGAHLTIAAVHAEDSRGGLFSALLPKRHAHRLSVPSTQEEDEPGIFARHAFPHMNERYLGSLAASSPGGEELPLIRRAWFFQECFLSQRVLLFTASELAWRCSARTACQCRGSQNDASPENPPGSIGSRVANPRGYHNTTALQTALQESGKVEVSQRWLSLVSDYSMLNMTFERDVLPALSGLAKVFGRLLETQYRAGIWEGFILPGLLWHPADGSKKKWGSRPREWRAPSWSWASANMAVSFPSVGELSNPCKILSVECPLRGSDATGEVVGGEMVVRGLVFPANVKHRVISGERYTWNVYVLDFMDGGILGNSYADYDWTADGPGKVEDGAAVRCLLVGEQAEQGTCYLLVLRESAPSDRTSEGGYERIGFVELFGNNFRDVSADGTVRMVSPFEDLWQRLAKEVITLV
ncbi:HET domain-containing protein [Candidatus Bathyarchaeota archaeon]|nr:HET domain-containing protein [Candidatus Bathyarchaeota archaeon]